MGTQKKIVSVLSYHANYGLYGGRVIPVTRHMSIPLFVAYIPVFLEVQSPFLMSKSRRNHPFCGRLNHVSSLCLMVKVTILDDLDG